MVKTHGFPVNFPLNQPNDFQTTKDGSLSIIFTAHAGQVVLRDEHQAVVGEPNVLLHLLQFFAKEVPPATPVGGLGLNHPAIGIESCSQVLKW
jgi:hypothetical protein